MSIKNRGYVWPEIIDPGEAVCIKVYVPADPLYIGAFFNAYGMFAKWVAWEKDAAHTAAQVAAVWKPYIDQTVAEWDAAGGECATLDLRQSPTDSCKLEVQYTPGGAWVQFADISLCKPAAIQPLYPSGEAWKELDDLLWHMKSKIELIDFYLDSGYTANQIKTLMGGQSAQFPSLPAMIDSLAAMDDTTRNTTIAAIDWQEARIRLWCQSDCGVLLPDDYYGWLDCVSAELLGVLQQTSDWLLGLLDDAAAAFTDTATGWEWATASGGGGAGFGGTEPTCGWHLIHDFAINQWGWALSNYLPGGVYSDGAWQTTDTHHDSWRRHLYIRHAWVDVGELQKCTITFDMSKGNFDNPPVINCLYISDDQATPLAMRTSAQILNGTDLQFTWLGHYDSFLWDWYIQVMCSLTTVQDDLSGAAKLKKVEMWGIGAPPSP